MLDHEFERSGVLPAFQNLNLKMKVFIITKSAFISPFNRETKALSH